MSVGFICFVGGYVVTIVVGALLIGIATTLENKHRAERG